MTPTRSQPRPMARYRAIIPFDATPNAQRSAFTLDFDSLIVVTAGVYCALSPTGSTVTADQGTVVYHAAGERRDCWCMPSAPTACYHLMFDWHGRSVEPPFSLPDVDGRIRVMAKWLHDERLSRESRFDLIADHILSGILGEYLRLWDRQGEDLVLSTRAYIRAHMRESITLDQLAAQAGLSRFYFPRRFKALAGHSPMHAVQRERIETARHMLMTTRVPQKAIAQAVGLTDESHLARLFRKHLGLRPGEVRRSVARPAT